MSCSFCEVCLLGFQTIAGRKLTFISPESSVPITEMEEAGVTARSGSFCSDWRDECTRWRLNFDFAFALQMAPGQFARLVPHSRHSTAQDVKVNRDLSFSYTSIKAGR